MRALFFIRYTFLALRPCQPDNLLPVASLPLLLLCRCEWSRGDERYYDNAQANHDHRQEGNRCRIALQHLSISFTSTY